MIHTFQHRISLHFYVELVLLGNEQRGREQSQSRLQVQLELFAVMESLAVFRDDESERDISSVYHPLIIAQ